MDIVFSTKWFEKHQQKLIWLLNAPIIKNWFRWVMCIYCKETINEITPSSYTFNGRYIDNETVGLKTDFRTHDKYSKRLYFAFKPFWYFLHFFDWAMLDRVEALTKLSFGFSTLTAYPGNGTVTNAQGIYTYLANQTFTALRANAGGGIAGNNPNIVAMIVAYSNTDKYSEIDRGGNTFDTSALTSGATISGAVISAYGAGKSNGLGSLDFGICAFTPANNATFVASDFGQFGSTSFGSKAYADYSTIDYNDITLDANGMANISKTGISGFGFRIANDISGSEPTWANGADSSFTFKDSSASSDPKLVVTYTVVVGPANLKSYNTNLSANIKSICTNLIANCKSLNTNV